MLKIKLQRIGAKKQPYYRVVVAEARSARGGRPVEILGHYIPLQEPEVLEVKQDRVKHWLGQGAQPTDRANRILAKLGIPGVKLAPLPPMSPPRPKKKAKASAAPGATAEPAAPSAPPAPEKK